MSYYDQFKNQWQAFGDIEEVTYTDAAGDQEAVKARRIDPTQKELESIESMIELQGDYATFNLWDVSLGGKIPGGSGLITQADGTKWNVLSVTGAQWGTQHLCLCVQQKVVT